RPRETGESGLPSIWMTRPSSWKTRCAQPTAQYGQMLSATPSAVAVRGAVARVVADVTALPRPVGSAPRSCRRTGQSRNVRRAIWACYQRRSGRSAAVGALVADPLVMADRLGDDEPQERLGEGRVEAGLVRQLAEMGDLLLLARGIGGRQPVLGLQQTHPLRVGEALGEQVHEGGIDVVDAAALAHQQPPGAFDVLSVVVAGGRVRDRHAERSWRPRRSCASASLPVSISGARPSVTTPSVMTTLTTSSHEGTSNMTSCRDSSRIARRPRAPVSRSIARSAMASRALRSKSSSTPSRANIFSNCFTRALRGSVRIVISASRSRFDTLVITGRRPMNSGISPNLSRSSGRSLP